MKTTRIELKQGHHTLSHGMYSLEPTKQALFINGPYNETAAAQGPRHGDRVGSGKERSRAIWER